MTDICKGMEEPTRMIGYAGDWTKATNYQEWQKPDLKKQRTKSLNGLMKMNLEYKNISREDKIDVRSSTQETESWNEDPGLEMLNNFKTQVNHNLKNPKFLILFILLTKKKLMFESKVDKIFGHNLMHTKICI
jgi:hypothetical protein